MGYFTYCNLLSDLVFEDRGPVSSVLRLKTTLQFCRVYYIVVYNFDKGVCACAFDTYIIIISRFIVEKRGISVVVEKY